MEDCSTDKRLRQKTLCHRQWTDEYVERPETLMRHSIIVDWIQCLLENKRATVKINKPTEFWTLASPCQLWGTGACAPVNFQLSNFSGHFRAAQPLGIRLHVVDHAVKLYTRLFVTVYCMNFITFLCAILNYFLVSCPSSHQILGTPLILDADSHQSKQRLKRVPDLAPWSSISWPVLRECGYLTEE